MISTALRQFRLTQKHLYTVGIIVGILGAEAIVGRWTPRGQGLFLLAVVITALGGFLTLVRLDLAVFGLLILTGFDLPPLYTVKERLLTPILAVTGLITVGMIFRLMLRKELRLPPRRLALPMLAVLVVWTLSIINSYPAWDYRVPTEGRLLIMAITEPGAMFLLFGLTCAVVHSFRSLQQVKLLLGVMLVWYTFVNARAIPAYFVSELPRAGSIVAARLPSGPVDVIPGLVSFIWSLLLFASPRGGIKTGLILLLMLNLFMCIITTSAILYLSTGVAMLVIAYFKSRRLFFIMAVIALILGVAARPVYKQHEPSVLDRLEEVSYGTAMFRDQPVLGVGPSNYRLYTKVYYPGKWQGTEGGRLRPHNLWLYWLASTGVAGVLSLIVLAATVVHYAWSLFRRTRDGFHRAFFLGLLAMTLALNVNAYLGRLSMFPVYGPEIHPLVHIWILVGLMVSLEYLGREEGGGHKRARTRQALRTERH